MRIVTKTSPMTVKQRDLLSAMQRGVQVHYVRFADYYFREDTLKRCGREVNGLLMRGHVEKCDERPAGHLLRVAKPF